MLRNLKSLPVYLLTISSLHYFNFSLNSQWDMYAVCFPTKSFLTIKIALQSSIILITCTGGWFISSTFFQMFPLAEVKVWDVKPYKNIVKVQICCLVYHLSFVRFVYWWQIIYRGYKLQKWVYTKDCVRFCYTCYN